MVLGWVSGEMAYPISWDVGLGGWVFGYEDFSFGYAALLVDLDGYYTVAGSGFPPNEYVTVTFCEDNYYWFEAYANDCGAFYYDTYIPSDFGYGNYDYQMMSIKAWVDAEVDEGDWTVTEGELYASYPLYFDDSD